MGSSGPHAAVGEEGATGALASWSSPTLYDVLQELSAEEKARLRSQGFLLPEDGVIPSIPSYPKPCVGEDDESIISTVCDALDHYNARHPGDEFDVVKPVAQDGLYFRNQMWLHMNFWARSHNSKKIKRLFAEVHYKPPPCSDPSFPYPITVVESCCIIEEPLAQYRSSCACCRGYFDILHPMDDREFVCGNGNANDWMIKKRFGMRFISRRDPANSNSQG